MTILLSQIYSETNKKLISNVKLKGLGPEKVLIKKNDLRVFCEKLPFDSLFSSESCIFPVGFLCVLKMYHVRLYIVEKMEFGTALKLCEIHFKPQLLLQKTCLFHAPETPVAYTGMCLCTHALVHVCKLLPTYMG